MNKDFLTVGFFIYIFISVRQKVLERENHELVLPGKGTFKLTLQLPTDDVHDASEGKSPTKVSKGVSKREVGCFLKVCGMGSTMRTI